MAADVEGIELLARAPDPPAPGRTTSALAEPLELIGAYHGGRLIVVYDGGAVMRDGLEIDSSPLVGRVERGAIVRARERRNNSCNIARFAIEHRGVRGWVSERIRGGDEELIVDRCPPRARGAGAGGASGASGAAGWTSRGKEFYKHSLAQHWARWHEGRSENRRETAKRDRKRQTP